uniref:Uncharacterized protein n=1 Tax=Solanum tuberosum TaxID=4113 RepID=M1C7V1_SOLTU
MVLEENASEVRMVKTNYRMLASGNQEGLGMDQSFRDSSESVVRGNLQTYRREMQRLYRDGRGDHTEKSSSLG